MFALPMTGPAAHAAMPMPGISTTSTTADPAAGGGDLLAAMNPAMDAAFAVGRPTDAGGAAAILGTTGAYIEGATATLARLDEGIEQRQRTLSRLELADPEAAAKLRTQLDLLQRLRDRIQLSIERVSETIAGVDEPDDPAGGGSGDGARLRRRQEELELLERRRELLGTGSIAATSVVDTSMVAGTYGAGRAPGSAGAA